MSAEPQLLLTLQACADLADVRRPVVSVWRSRLRESSSPFPAPIDQAGGRLMFDARAVARWLEATGHGNNPHADVEAASHATIADFSVDDPGQLAAAAALITLRALTGQSLASIADVAAAARAHDPDDRFLVGELASGLPETLLAFVDAFVDACYTPADALERLLARATSSATAAGSMGPLTEAATDLVAETVLTLAVTDDESTAVVCDPAGGSDDLLIAVARAAEDRLEVGFGVTASGSVRMLRRRFALRGIHAEVVDASPAGREGAVYVSRFPSSAHPEADILDGIDELALGMTDADRSVVLAPAAILTDPVDGRDLTRRADLLRTGRVRGIVRLPAGLVTSAPRQALALWVLGREHGNTPVEQRYTVVADLSDAELTPATRDDIVSDLVAALGDAAGVRAHAFRFARFVPTAALLAGDGSLVAEAELRRPRSLPARERRDIPALLDAALADAGDAAPLPPSAITAVTGGSARPPATLGALAAAGQVRVFPGTRVRAADIGDVGFAVVGVEELHDDTLVGSRAVDRLRFADAYPRAALTEPGDVVFCTSPQPAAWVDAAGSHVVAYPARVLRVRAGAGNGIVPEILAADIASQPPTARSWRRWLVRRVAAEQVQALRAALSLVDAAREELRARLAAVDRVGVLLAEGATSAAIAVTIPDIATEHVA